MSRVRQAGGLWFDKHQHNDVATPEQLERLADLMGEELDDLLDAGFRQKEVLEALREFEGTNNRPDHIPPYRPASPHDPCRICTPRGWECEGSSSKHHFVPKWMMKQLENYKAYAPRSVCTIPICIGRHRDLHLRGEEETPKSVASILNSEEKGFANKLLGELRAQHPQLFETILGGDEGTYEHILIMDFVRGKFRS